MIKDHDVEHIKQGTAYKAHFILQDDTRYTKTGHMIHDIEYWTQLYTMQIHEARHVILETIYTIQNTRSKIHNTGHKTQETIQDTSHIILEERRLQHTVGN